MLFVALLRSSLNVRIHRILLGADTSRYLGEPDVSSL